MSAPSQKRKTVAQLRDEGALRSSKREIWEKFVNDHALLDAHNVKPGELEALERIAMLGSIDSEADLIFILSAIRRPRRK